MRTKIHWARKSQQPADVAWTVSRENGGFKLIRNWTTNKNVILTTDRVITYLGFKYRGRSQITDKANSRQNVEKTDSIENDGCRPASRLVRLA